MDNLHSALHAVAEHHDHADYDFGRGATSVRPIATRTVVETVPAGGGWYHEAAIDEARREAIEASSNPYHH